ncbi:hypothetical protein DL93DRAFT_1166009 [Clavulina sp. PMI_390]|nr:hypothetical protein DL93DRAFT_1166009 [Clavulina sp. PMI_390]
MSELADGAPRRPARQDTFDLRQDIIAHEDLDDSLLDNEYEDVYDSVDDQQNHSVLEDEDEEEDDESSQLSIPNETIDFDRVYSLRNFHATTEGQANVNKGDELILMDDTNSYWWLVKVLPHFEIGYIPAENIETPVERLARLNKHRNVDLASPTPADRAGAAPEVIQPRRRIEAPGDRKSVLFMGSSIYYYPPFQWGDPSRPLDDVPDDTYGVIDDGDYAAYEDAGVYEVDDGVPQDGEPDDGMSWEDEMSPASHSNEVVAPRAEPASLAAQSPLQQAQPAMLIPTRDASIAPTLRERSSKENLTPTSSSPTSRVYVDPAEVQETRKLSVTPNVARDSQSSPGASPTNILGPSHNQRALSISSVGSGASSSESMGLKRGRDEGDSDAESKRAKGKASDRKLRKERSGSGESETSQTSDGKKKGGFFGNLFNRKKDRDPNTRRVASPADMDTPSRSSLESAVTGSAEHDFEGMSEPSRPILRAPAPTENPQAREWNRGQVTGPSGNTSYTPRLEPTRTEPSRPGPAASNSLQPPVRGSRPGSLILSTSAPDGLSAIVPELSVLRVFAGDHLQSEATFKTVLVNASTTTPGLIRQAMQRFRLPEGENPDDYYLTIRQIDGDEAVLRPEEHPLQAFEQLAERSVRIPSMKRASMGSINSLASNLTMSIAKLGMNDFTDDSNVKLYLHRTLKGSDGEITPRDSTDLLHDSAHELTVSTSNLSGVSPEKFSSPSARFAIQIVIFPDDLPDGMVFDPHTEAIVPRSTLQYRSSTSSAISPGVSQTQRRKIFTFPRNTTVAEVIEASLERFGILEGLVEGGDEVEDKAVKRRSSTSRVRYGLNVALTNGQPEKELQPSTKILDVFPRPPVFKVVDRRVSEWRRRSAESTHLMGTDEDVLPDDPCFILRRVTGTRNIKGRSAGPLDELALRQLRRESASSDASGLSSSASSQRTQKGLSASGPPLTVRPNRENGLDIITEVGIYRSQRMGQNTPTYTFSQRNAEPINITALVLEEFGQGGDAGTDLFDQASMGSTTVLSSNLTRLQGRIVSEALNTSSAPSTNRAAVVSPSVYSASSRAGSGTGSARGEEPASPSAGDFRSRGSTPTGSTRTTSPGPMASRAATTPLVGSRASSPSQRPVPGHQQQPSIASILSDLSAYTSTSDPDQTAVARSTSARPSVLDKVTPSTTSSSISPATGVSGISRMLAIIELNATLGQPPRRPGPSVLDQIFLGTGLNVEELHPRVREFYEPNIRDMQDLGKDLDRLLAISHSF